MDFGPGLVHVRQILHVSTISSINGSTSLGAPACCSNSFILLAGACHHLRWSLRRHLRTTPSRTERSSCSMEPRSNWLHDLPSAAAAAGSPASSTAAGAAGTNSPWSACVSESALAGPFGCVVLEPRAPLAAGAAGALAILKVLVGSPDVGTLGSRG